MYLFNIFYGAIVLNLHNETIINMDTKLTFPPEFQGNI